MVVVSYHCIWIQINGLNSKESNSLLGYDIDHAGDVNHDVILEWKRSEGNTQCLINSMIIIIIIIINSTQAMT